MWPLQVNRFLNLHTTTTTRGPVTCGWPSGMDVLRLFVNVDLLKDNSRTPVSSVGHESVPRPPAAETLLPKLVTHTHTHTQIAHTLCRLRCSFTLSGACSRWHHGPEAPPHPHPEAAGVGRRRDVQERHLQTLSARTPPTREVELAESTSSQVGLILSLL